MKVKVYQARLIVEEKEVKLTKSVGRQFPLLDGRARNDRAREGLEGKKPIGKVRIQALGHPDTSGYSKPWAPRGWLYLVQDDEAGLAWTPIILPVPGLAKRMLEAGGWIDHPEDVPTIIL